jgi:hypothetical protein
VTRNNPQWHSAVLSIAYSPAAFLFFASHADAKTYRCSLEGKHMARDAEPLC